MLYEQKYPRNRMLFSFYHPNTAGISESRFKTFALILAAMLSHSPARAVQDAPVSEAMLAIQSKQAQKAFDALSPLEASRAGDPDFDLALGIAANETGQFARAIFALERVLAVQPANGRARAELARALFAVGDNANAKKLLQETKAEGVPESVGQTIDEFLQAIEKVDEAGRSSFRMYLEAGGGFDSNVNSGPSQNSFAVPALGGLVVTLLPAGQKTDASFWQLGAGFSGRLHLAPRWSFIGNANLSTRKHDDDADRFDMEQIDASAGVSYREERHEFSGVLNFAHTAFDGKVLRKISGITGEWTYRPDGLRQWGTYLQISQLEYPRQSLRDADRFVLGTSYAQQLGGKIIYYVGGYLGSEQAQDDRFPFLGHKLFGLRTGLQLPVHPNWSLFASASLENRRYSGTDPSFLIVRRDTQLDINVGATWAIADKWSIKPQISFNRVHSNVVINDSNKYSVSVMARREF
jgi:outer membrane protein